MRKRKRWGGEGEKHIDSSHRQTCTQTDGQTSRDREKHKDRKKKKKKKDVQRKRTYRNMKKKRKKKTTTENRNKNRLDKRNRSSIYDELQQPIRISLKSERSLCIERSTKPHRQRAPTTHFTLISSLPVQNNVQSKAKDALIQKH